MTDDWRARAKCHGMNPDLFYPKTAGRGSGTEAKRICRSCPVQPDCLNAARQRDEQFGIWGGRSFNYQYRARTEPDFVRSWGVA